MKQAIKKSFFFTISNRLKGLKERKSQAQYEMREIYVHMNEKEDSVGWASKDGNITNISNMMNGTNI